MNKNRSSRGFKLAIVAAALAASATVFAGDAGPQRSFHGHPASQGEACPGHFHENAHRGHRGMQGGHGHHHARMQDAGLIVPGYGVVSRDFVDGMGLNPDQLKRVEDARKAAKAWRDGVRERIKAERGARSERFSAGTALDPEQALKQADERRAKAQAERRQVDEKWVAVWKSLDASQQARIAEHLKQRAEKAQTRAEQRAEARKPNDAAKVERGSGKMAS